MISNLSLGQSAEHGDPLDFRGGVDGFHWYPGSFRYFYYLSWIFQNHYLVWQFSATLPGDQLSLASGSAALTQYWYLGGRACSLPIDFMVGFHFLPHSNLLKPPSLVPERLPDHCLLVDQTAVCNFILLASGSDHFVRGYLHFKTSYLGWTSDYRTILPSMHLQRYCWGNPNCRHLFLSDVCSGS